MDKDINNVYHNWKDRFLKRLYLYKYKFVYFVLCEICVISLTEMGFIIKYSKKVLKLKKKIEVSRKFCCNFLQLIKTFLKK